MSYRLLILISLLSCKFVMINSMNMIQIAVFSDVHGNLPALNSVLKDIEERGIRQKFCLGDLVDFAPWGNEVIENIRSLNILCLMGNHDERIAFDIPVVPLSKHSEEETSARFIAIDHSKKHITEENKKFLSELSFLLKLNYKVGKKHWNIQLVHSSLSSNDTYLYELECWKTLSLTSLPWDTPIYLLKNSSKMAHGLLIVAL